MNNNLSFRKKIFLWTTATFVVFTLFVLLFQYDREKEFKKEELEQKLNNITEITHNYIINNDLYSSGNYKMLRSLKSLIPDKDLRITIISPKGIVLFDSKVTDFQQMENHLHRPEIQQSIVSGFGSNIRKSATTGKEYYYCAKYYPDYFIRTATIYDVEIKRFLEAEKTSFIYITALLLILLIVFFWITKNISKSISRLKDFTVKLSTGKPYDKEIVFPNDELGTISKQMIILYDKLNSAKENITLTNNKLFAHLQALNEGIAFFSSNKKHILSNSHFIQYLNFIADKSTISPENFLELEAVENVIDFINQHVIENTVINTNDLPFYEMDLHKNGKYFNIWCTTFQDKSFEIVIKDDTKLKKRKLLKQQLTSNIAHELKTPVTTIMGYLETLSRNSLTEEKQNYFISKAFAQATRLSELIEDIGVLNKIEESGEMFQFENITLMDIVNDVIDNIRVRLEQQNIQVNVKIPNDLVLSANKSLLFSIFLNLFDNAIKYGGKNIEINVEKYNEDKKSYYFSFSNTGNSIDKKHFSRIFERFYRIESGRSRKTGGTGLGLSIVKNAIELHSGTISITNNTDNNGVNFLFTLAKGS